MYCTIFNCNRPVYYKCLIMKWTLLTRISVLTHSLVRMRLILSAVAEWIDNFDTKMISRRAVRLVLAVVVIFAWENIYTIQQIFYIRSVIWNWNSLQRLHFIKDKGTHYLSYEPVNVLYWAPVMVSHKSCCVSSITRTPLMSSRGLAGSRASEVFPTIITGYS